MSWESVSRLLVAGVISGSAFGLLGAGFALILGVTHRFHFAYGITYTLAPYLVFSLSVSWGLPFWAALVAAVAVTCAAGAAIEVVIYRPMVAAAGASSLLAVFVTSLGIGIAGENALHLLYGSAPKTLPTVPSGLRAPLRLGHITIRWLDLWQVVVAIVMVLALTALLARSGLGRAIRATRSNPELARIVRIDPDRVAVTCFAIGTSFAAVAGVFYATKFSMSPGMGNHTVILGFVVAFLAGLDRSPLRVLIVGIAVGVLQQLSTLWLATRWSELVVFVLLVGYLLLKTVDVRRWLPRRLAEAG